MADITSGCVIEATGYTGHIYKQLYIETEATADTADTIAITLSKYGATKLKDIKGCVHTTENSVVVGEVGTTAVANGILTITVGGSTVSDKKRVYNVILA